MLETQNCSRVHPTFSQMKINKYETDRPTQAGHSTYYTELRKASLGYNLSHHCLSTQIIYTTHFQDG